MVAQKIVKKILGDKFSKNNIESKQNYTRLSNDGKIGTCQECGKRDKLYSGLCYNCLRK